MMPSEWALFKDGKQASKAHPSRMAVLIEAYEAGAIVRTARGAYFADGYEIKEVSDAE